MSLLSPFSFVCLEDKAHGSANTRINYADFHENRLRRFQRESNPPNGTTAWKRARFNESASPHPVLLRAFFWRNCQWWEMQKALGVRADPGKTQGWRHGFRYCRERETGLAHKQSYSQVLARKFLFASPCSTVPTRKQSYLQVPTRRQSYSRAVLLANSLTCRPHKARY